MDATYEGRRKLSTIVHKNQTQALETLLADLQGRALFLQRVVLYSLLTFLLLFTFYWLTAWLLQHQLALRDTLTGQLDKLSASQSTQLEQLAARLESMEAMMSGQVMAQLKEGMEGNVLKLQ